MKKLYCKDCNKYLGEIREATLMKDIAFICPDCNVGLVDSILKKVTKKSEEFVKIFDKKADK